MTIIRIKHSYPFRVAERDAIDKAIQEVTGIRIGAWYTDWPNNEYPVDVIELQTLTKTAQRQVTQMILVVMRAYINMHHDRRSFAEPEEMSA